MEKHFKQLIIARRDLNMSPGKLAAQGFYQVNYRLDEDIYDNWINDGVIEKAKELGMIEGELRRIFGIYRTKMLRIEGTYPYHIRKP